MTTIAPIRVRRRRWTPLLTRRQEGRLPSRTSNHPLSPQQEAIAGGCLSGAGQVASRRVAPPPTTNGTAPIMAVKVTFTGAEASPLPVASSRAGRRVCHVLRGADRCRKPQAGAWPTHCRTA